MQSNWSGLYQTISPQSGQFPYTFQRCVKCKVIGMIDLCRNGSGNDSVCDSHALAKHDEMFEVLSHWVNPF